jgi:uncharacterized protein (DUF849 family)
VDPLVITVAPVEGELTREQQPDLPLYLSKGRRGTSNAELVSRVVRIAAETGREPASPDQAREMLGITGGSG